MAFSFNWAGVTAPQVPTYKDPVTPEDFAALGNAARGYQNRAAAKEYAKRIEEFRKSREASDSEVSGRAAQIRAEIARLETENANFQALIDEKILNYAQKYNGQMALSNMFKPDELDAMAFDPESSSTTPEDINKILGYLGMSQTGVWSPEAQSAFDNKYGFVRKMIQY